MKRNHIIQWIINTRQYKSYLEIGVWNGRNFNSINIDRKVSVDPLHHPTYRMTSDTFFNQNKDIFDLIFIDGLHYDYQVLRDIENSLGCLSNKGLILVHDCLPTCEAAQLKKQTHIRSGWNGDCWKAFAYLRATRTDLAMFTIARDQGIGVIIPNSIQVCYEGPYDTYQDFVNNKQDMMNICGFRTAGKIIKML